MQVGQIPIQILVSLGLLVCAVIAAIMFDLIKGKNEQLREMMIELKVRNDESARREQLLMKMQAPAFPAAAFPEIKLPAPAEIAAATPQASRHKPRRQRTHVLSADAQAAIGRGIAMAGNPKHASRRLRNLSLITETEPRICVAEGVEMMGIAIAPPVKLHLLPAAQSGQLSVFSPENLTPVERRAPYRGFKLKAIVIEFVQANSSAQPVLAMEQIATSAQKNWGELISGRAAVSHRGLLAAVMAATASPDRTPNAVPPGYHDGMVLTSLLKNRQPVSGLVVSIGVTGEVSSAVCGMVKSLLGPSDFGCQAGLNEFLLFYPSQRGTSAQSKLSGIAQQLGNFQLGMENEASILFSWGGVEARSEPVETAVTSANRQMHETRRGRNNLVTMAPREPQVRFALPKAV